MSVLPVATGMAITLALLAQKRDRNGAKFILWPRIDQKTCVKAIVAAGLEIIVRISLNFILVRPCIPFPCFDLLPAKSDKVISFSRIC